MDDLLSLSGGNWVRILCGRGSIPAVRGALEGTVRPSSRWLTSSCGILSAEPMEFSYKKLRR